MGSIRAYVSIAILGCAAGCLADALPPLRDRAREAPEERALPRTVAFEEGRRRSVIVTGEEARSCRSPSAAHALRLLTRFEYNNTVRDLLGDLTRPADALPGENRVLGFENNADAHGVNPSLVLGYQEIAEGIARRALSMRMSEIVRCDPGSIGEERCARSFLEMFLPKAFRRPITKEERARFTEFLEVTRMTYDFRDSIGMLIEVVLQSPQFLYRIEAPLEHARGGAIALAGGHDVATRLSYFLWSSMPDEGLFRAARTGALSTRNGIESEARRMLDDPRARAAIIHFHHQWLGLDALSGLVKDRATFPEYSAGLRSSWLTSVERFVEHVYFEGDSTVSALFLSPLVFVDGPLAELYRAPLPAPGSVEPRAMEPAVRAGLLTQPAILAMLSAPDQTSPIRRGVFVREKVLCESLPPPPPGVAVTPPDPDPRLTTRERFEAHTAQAACAGCHRLIDPIGFGFERFDALGRYRAQENGAPIDARGSIVGARDPSIDGVFDGAVELSSKLAESKEVRDCLVRQWFRYAMGRLETEGDACSLAEASAYFATSGGSLRELLVAIARTDAFRYEESEDWP